MAKIIFLLVALVTIQGCFSSSIIHPKLNELEEIVQEYATSMREVHEIISFISGHLTAIGRDYELSIGDILENHPLYPFIEDLRSTISKLESEAEDSKNCFNNAWTQSTIATEDMKKGVDNCLSEAHFVSGHMKSILEILNRKATKIQTELGSSYSNCLQNTEMVLCLNKNIETLKKDLINLKQQVSSADKQMQKESTDAKRHLNICLQHEKENIVEKSDNIVETLNKCLKQKNSSRGIFDFLRELKEKLISIIETVTNLPATIDFISDKINEIVSHINISALYSQLKTEVHDIIANGGPEAQKCLPEADEKLNAIVKNAEDTNKICMAKTEAVIEDIETQFHDLVTESKNMLVEMNQSINKCFLDNKLNPIGLAKCFKTLVSEFQEKISNLQTKIEETIENSKTNAKDMLLIFAGCLNEVQLDTIRKGQALIKEVESCVSNSYHSK